MSALYFQIKRFKTLMLMKYTINTFIFVMFSFLLFAEDGSKLWLRYASPETVYDFSRVTIDENTPTLEKALKELSIASQSFTEKDIEASKATDNSSLIIGTVKSKNIASIIPAKDFSGLGNDGYIIQTINKGGIQSTVIASNTDIGVLYGVFHFLRLIQTNQLPESVNIKETPKYDIRILNHWDNLDGTIERGYAGYSLWKWGELPYTLSPRYEDYARANASIGINATVLNNVNASPQILSKEYLTKVKALAEVFRPYGIKVYLAVNFSSSKELGGLSDSDPLNK